MKKYSGLIVYIIAIILIIVSFVLPPTGVIDNSVLLAVGILIGGYQMMFGNSIKEIKIDKEGVHIVNYEKSI